MATTTVDVPVGDEWLSRYPRYRVSVDEYVTFHERGFLVVRNLVPAEDVEELRLHTEDLLAGKHRDLGGTTRLPGQTASEIERRMVRIHMLHRHLAIHERYLLHPRLLDVLEALVGPEVMAMQTMLFLKPPGSEGQGFHQDSYYIPTHPDTLIGAWLAIDRADEENGCLWMSVGSQHEPIYPDVNRLGQNHADGSISDLTIITNASHNDEEQNGLTPIARKYAAREVPIVAEPGDVAFFGGHIIHRSLRNRSSHRYRRSFVSHYANARAFTCWGSPDRASPANDLHILARGSTHLPFAQPKFGTPCAANRPELTRGGAPAATMGEGDMMATVTVEPSRNDPASHRH
ncbi:MAG: phytanoyl-CoA dioxygenase family protein [Chloroflexi bacterium]|nr:phytanoyl-CoA dioxygenase family protein [Chloroflexota bacterium]